MIVGESDMIGGHGLMKVVVRIKFGIPWMKTTGNTGRVHLHQSNYEPI